MEMEVPMERMLIQQIQQSDGIVMEMELDDEDRMDEMLTPVYLTQMETE